MRCLKEIKVAKLDFDTFRLLDGSTGEVQTYSLHDLLKVNQQNYQEEFLQQPAKYVYWQAVLQNLKAYEESTEREAEHAHADSYNEAYNYFRKQGNARPTKDLIESAILLDDTYQEKLEAVEQAKESVGIINAIVKAFEQRKDMLIQFGAEQRQSYKNSN